jgi:2-succinyl-6-hydroxy-2,4-cyclohexadiene-1-carboxylate synthase
MIIKIDELDFNVLVDDKNILTNSTPIVFLHGLGGSEADWLFLFDKLPIGYYPVAIDLIGHGKTSSSFDVEKYSTDAIISQLDKIFSGLKINKFILSGYSMGGRAAISYIVNHPRKVKALILESASPGIKLEKERADRIFADELLALKIEKEGIEKFTDYWLELPLFKSLKNISRDDFIKHRNQKLKNNPIGLANSLRGFSPGKMPNYWNALPQIKQKTLLISGGMDEKYTSINSEACMLLPNASHFVIKNCGHNVHLEKPSQFIKLVSDFLNSL